MRKSKILGLLIVISLAFVLSGFIQQTTEETVTCPVSGKVMKKSEAKATCEYQGKAYYFCCENAKEKFIKDPGAYLQQKEERKGLYTCPMHPEVKADKPGKCPECGMNLKKKAMPQRQGMMMHQSQMGCCPKMEMGAQSKGCAMNCPLHSEGVEMKSENVADGVSVKITSKNPEMVKRIQEHYASMKACCQKTPPTAKQEEKK
jgi:YHS domain-containing protein